MNPLAKAFNNLITRGFEFFGRYYSSYRGWVVDNVDPEGYGRVKVKVPQVYGTQTMNYWAWPKGVFSGPDYGVQCTPPKGSMVYVEFEMGDAKKPIWSHGHFAKSAGVKEKPEDLSDIQKYWFKTPGGLLVLLDDASMSISLKSAGGNEVEMNDNAKYIRVKTNKGFYIEINDTGISAVADTVSLINLDGSNNEPGVLGDKNADALSDLQQVISTLYTSLIAIGAADATMGTNLGLTFAASLQSLNSQMATVNGIQTKISQTKSTKVSLS